MLSRIQLWARGLRRDVHAIYLASRDPRVPWYAKVLAIAVAGYALSPVDLIPELVLPLIGLGDDAVVIGWIAVALINETESFLSWERDRDLTLHEDVIVGDVIR